MFDDTLKNTWKRAEADAPRLSLAALEALLRPAARTSGRALAFLAWTQITLLGLSALLACINLRGYRGNPRMLAVELTLALSSLGLAALGLRFVARLRETRRADLPLLETVALRLAFHRRFHGPGLVVSALSPWLLTLAINTLVDNEHGTYRVHHPLEFVLVSAGMIALTYTLVRISTSPLGRELEAMLQDLQAEALEATPRVDAVKRRARAWRLAGVVLVALAVLLTFLLWLGG